MIALTDSQNSWVAKWNGIGLLELKDALVVIILFRYLYSFAYNLCDKFAAECVPGLYAIKVVGKLPEDLQRDCEDKGLICRSTNK